MTFGRYTVQRRPWVEGAQYFVFLGNVLIGKSVSLPDLGCCEWLHRQQRDRTFYAYSSAPVNELTKRRKLTNQRGVNQHNRKVGAPRKPETLQDIAKALAGG